MHALSKSSTCLSFGLTQRITHPEHSFITAKFTNYHSQAIAALRSLEAQLHRGDNHYAQPPGGWDGKRHRAGKTENQVTQNLTHFFFVAMLPYPHYFGEQSSLSFHMIVCAFGGKWGWSCEYSIALCGHLALHSCVCYASLFPTILWKQIIW